MSFAQATVGRGMTVSHGADDNLWVEFFYRPVQDPRATETEGRPIFREVPYVRIFMPGDKSTEVCRKVKDDDKMRFAKQWDAFQKGAEPIVNGTPLDQWPLLSVAQIAEFKALHIFTVEALAGVADSTLHQLGIGGRAIVAKAKAFIEDAKGKAPMQALVAENETLKEQIAALTVRMNALAAAQGGCNAA